MKKATKRLMMVVAILLCLVLISTSVVSGIFARFIIQKSATTSVGFTNFGMTVDLEVSNKLTVSGTPTKKGDTVIATYNAINLKPGDDYSDLFKITISGTASVKTDITVDVDIVYPIDEFLVESDDFTALSSDAKYVPIGFKVNGAFAKYNSYETKPYHSYTDANAEQYVERALAAVTGLKYESTKLTKTLDPTDTDETNNSIAITSIPIGFIWPKDYDDNYLDELGTYLSLRNTDGNMKITTFSVSITVKQAD